MPFLLSVCGCLPQQGAKLCLRKGCRHQEWRELWNNRISHIRGQATRQLRLLGLTNQSSAVFQLRLLMLVQWHVKQDSIQDCSVVVLETALGLSTGLKTTFWGSWSSRTQMHFVFVLSWSQTWRTPDFKLILDWSRPQILDLKFPSSIIANNVNLFVTDNCLTPFPGPLYWSCSILMEMTRRGPGQLFGSRDVC